MIRVRAEAARNTNSAADVKTKVMSKNAAAFLHCRGSSRKDSGK